ncbi:MAG: HutP family protein [Clostridiales bacterium]|nr:HutP family protein [Clostridiales bacterium]
MSHIPESKFTSSAVIMLAITESREEEAELKSRLQDQGIKCAAVDFGGEFISSVSKIIEKAIVTSQKAGIISDSHNEEGAVAGAAREAVSQISQKAIGLNVGGKIAIARFGNHLSVCLYFGIGMLNLNEIAIGLGHRAV